MRHSLTIFGLLSPTVTCCAIEDFDQDGVARLFDCNDTDPSQGRPLSLHIDGDRDGYGGPELEVGCPGNAWLSTNNLDCNDNDATVHPGAPEVGCDGRDNDCSPSTVDGPAYTAEATWSSVQAALDAVAPGETVHLCASRIRERLVIRRSLVLLGSGADRTVIDAESTGSTITLLAPAELQALTVTGGLAQQGGGVFIDPSVQGAVRLTGIAVRENQAEEGAGIWLSDTPVSLKHTEVTGNVAALAGGGMYGSITSSQTIELTDSQFSYNRASQGGGIWLRGAAAAEQTVVSNNAADQGGGIWLDGTAESASRSLLLRENEALEGGALWGVGRVFGGQFTGNHAERGGAIHASGPLRIERSVLVGNDAQLGGAVLADATTVIDGTEFRGNTADERGAALYATCGPGVVNINDTLMDSNSAPEGAVLWIEGRSARVFGTQITNNASDVRGVVALGLTDCRPTVLDVLDDVSWVGNGDRDVSVGNQIYVAPDAPFNCAAADDLRQCDF